MNFNHQDSLNAIAAQLRDLSFSKADYQNPSSLMDSIGVQRAKSPFGGSQQDGGIFQAQFQKPLMGSWGQTNGFQQPMTPTTSLSSTAATPQTANNIPLQFERPMANSAGGIHPIMPPTASLSGFGSQFIPLMPCKESEWNYIDHAGQIQGPFTSGMMDSWFAQRFFMQTLQIKFSGNVVNPFGMDMNTFITLMELMTKVNDFIEPFKKFDLVCWQFQQQLQEQSFVQSRIASPVSLHPPLQSQPVASSKIPARIENHDYSYGEIMQLQDNDGGHYQEVSVVIPFSRTVKTLSDEEFSLEMDAHNLKLTIMKETSERESQKHAVSQEKVEQQIDQEQKTDLKSEGQSSYLAQEAAITNHQKTKPVANNESYNIKTTDSVQVTENSDSKASQEEPAIVHTAEKADASKDTEATRKPVARNEITSKPAPWANKQMPVYDTISLLEIQQKKEEERKKKQQEFLSNSRKQALQMQQEIVKQENQHIPITAVASWASKTKVTDSSKTEKDPEVIYPERFKDKDFIEKQKKLWEDAQRLHNSQKSASNTNEDEWTTVTTKHTQPKIIPKPVLTSANSYISPDKLRAASANNMRPYLKKPASAANISTTSKPLLYPGNASTSARREFLNWCRSQMNLSPGVKVNNVLEMLLSLPAGNESREIIADAIYSNSSIMDGRRFATEFLKRRIECEEKLKDNLTWSQALTLPEGDADDWEFQVVCKKKGKRH
ncbi:HCL505Cp [Eremothecium sinecaudum]|uniref:HCL505Cp n=1 Tax=Eremothecium sinecaudum TaxID=45286 RepID=A0A109UY19_9SACH|nr:HCL505Cp [Eremothecium sinecaudum]AMD19646.1 HCL505Cp [Eremothecium sinecaudum]